MQQRSETVRGVAHWRPRYRTVCTLALSLLGTAACGTSDKPGSDKPGAGDDQNPISCEQATPGPAPVRLLTRQQYDNTVRDLLGDTSQPGKGFPREPTVQGFENNANLHLANPLLIREYQQAAEELAPVAVGSGLQKFLDCDLSTPDMPCGEAFVESFTTRAFRRPPTDTEISALKDLLATGTEQFGFRTGLEMVVEATLQSPQFLYRIDSLAAPTPETGAVALGSYEMASRLSYFLWNTMPDDALFDAAESDALSSPDSIAEQARRMLDDPKARDVVHDFHRQWLQMDDFESISRDAPPEFTATLGAFPQSWRASLEAFIDHAFWDEGGDLSALLLSPTVFVDGALAPLYGVEAGDDTGPVAVDFDPAQRAGLLTQPALLALLSHPNQSTPVRRGKFVREQLLCDPLPPPPPNVDTTPPDPDPNLTTRQRFSIHSAAPECAVCHQRMDPIGFGLENYDHLGRFRSDEQGMDIDVSGKIIDARDPELEGPFDGPMDLAQRLAQSPQVRDCIATQWYRYAFGRVETEADSCSLQQAQAAFADSGNLKDLLVSITQTDAFLYRPPVEVTP